MKDRGIWIAGIGGGVGASLRYFVSILLPVTAFPFATLFVNLTGSYLLAFWSATLFENQKKNHLKWLLGTGLCGGFTTMSTFTYETVTLFQQQSFIGPVYLLLTVTGGLLMGLLGFKRGNRR